ncbi:MAG: 23S rRNA (uracil(1939)-C(5))-methyltransferase RlmD [Acholeplasmatales bacterium]|nr:23S rRNA (uracil(1939)-C(5))-methyltransferase RlmD [Acholeplasmatales bacterium]
MEKNVIFRCLKDSFDGKGIINYRGVDYKIEGIMKGEEGEFSVDKKAKYPLKLIKVVKPASDRNTKMCPIATECGGCQYQHMNYEHELSIKNEFIKDIFHTFRDFDYLGIVGMENPYNYRNKLQMTYKKSKSHRVTCGFYEEHTHKIISAQNCNIQAKKGNEIIEALNKILSKNHIDVYDEKSRKGIIRHVLLRYGFVSKEIMVIIVTNGEFFPGRANVVKELVAKNLGITTIVQNYNDRDTSIVLGDKERILYGNGFIYDFIGDMKFKISSRAFYQVNTEGMTKLYGKAIELADLKKNDIVLDTYCGVGTIGILASTKVKKVYGVELNKLSYKDAINNANLNNVKNITFTQGDSTEFMKKVASAREHIDVVIMDPPRSGSTEAFISSAASLSPRTIVYVSCNPLTLERDAYTFSKYGYSLKKLCAIDMFPRTFNVETVALLTLKVSAKK